MKHTKVILTALLLLFSYSLLTSCGGDGLGGTGKPQNGANLESTTKVSVPFREHGYSNFETVIINTQSKFDDFINDVKNQNNWNDKATFLQKLQAEQFDFSKINLLLYRITESSGSIGLSPQEPVIESNKITIKIDRQVPTILTADMAYYVLVYKIKKDIVTVTFDNGSSQATIDLASLSKAQGKLIRSNKSALLAYFKNSVKNFDSNNTERNENQVIGVADASGNLSVSSTNLQEAGVDEADLIKTNGQFIFSVKKNRAVSKTTNNASIGFYDENIKLQSDTIRILDTQASSGLSEVKSFSDKDKPWNIAGLYLYNKAEIDNKRLIALSSKKQQYWSHWFDSSYFENQETNVLFIDINDPSKASIATKLKFEGQLIDSRRNGDTLYLVLRHSSAYKYTDEINLSTTTNKTFLPSYQLGSASKQLISKPENCYLEKDQEGSTDVITLVAIDLKTSKPQVNSQCYVGSAEAIYASQNALYLATTRWNYQTQQGGVARYSQNVSTDIHKFAYNGLNFDYRGSGEVNGHLGHKQDSKSFRFSEHKGALRVVTFDEEMWNSGFVRSLQAVTSSSKKAKKGSPKSPVLLSILKEDTTSNTLQLISKLPNTNHPEPIGLPGEKLYASRFIGDRAYIVTFRVTDPLYVLDLSDSTDPKIAGELKIDGYSDYLHPISETLLLGLGKDAIPDESSAQGDGRGAWYQGVKLSLIDITDPSNPKEADKIVLGKRGTESTALFTHHGLTGLKVNDIYRVAIPVRLHTGTPSTSSATLSAQDYYDYTSIGLHRFEIDINNQTISKVPTMIVEDSQKKTNIDITTDRSVFINNDVFYMHNGNFWIQDWKGENTITGPK